MVIPESQLTFVNKSDSTCELLYTATDNAVAVKLALSIKQVAKMVVELQPSPYANLNGTIYVSIENDELDLPIGRAVAIDELVSQAVHPDMLEDEPEVENMLKEFRSRLLKSLGHVEQAIASLPKP